MDSAFKAGGRSVAIRIVAAYVLFGGLWIYLSDGVLAALIRDPVLLTRIALFKGFSFICFTAALLYHLIARYARESQRREDALRESEGRYRRLIESSHDWIWETGADCRFSFCSSQVQEILGYLPEEVVAREASDLMPEDARAVVRKEFAAIRERQAPFRNLVCTSRHKDGRTVVLETNGIPRYNEEKALVGYSGISRDITERQAAVESLRQSEERFRMAILNSPFPTMLHAEGGEILQISKAWTDLSGYTLADIPTVADWTVKAYTTRHGAMQGQIGSLSDPKDRVDEGEVALLTKGGEKRIWEFSSAPLVPLPDGRRLLISVARDVTDRKHLEEQLRQSQKMEAIGTLAGGVAHDFNNILTVIMGYAALINVAAEEGSRMQALAEGIITSVDRAAEMTKSLLAFSRKQTIDLAPCNLNDILRNFQRSLSRLIREDIEFTMLPGPESLVILADRGQIEQVIINLTVNAQDAMPEGGRLTIATDGVDIDSEDTGFYGVERPGRYALITVADNGIGIDGKIRGRIFEPFFTTKEVGKGTGLGLSTVYGIIKKHNGFINVYSEPGLGTTFKVYLPLTGERPPQGAREQRSEALPRGSETILLVEDDPAIRSMTRTLLEDYGYQVLTAADGEEALSTFNDNREAIQLLITDIVMPKKNGREIYAEIITLRPGLPTIFMSGYTADVTMPGELPGGGALHYLAKPLKPAHFLTKIRDVLGGAP